MVPECAFCIIMIEDYKILLAESQILLYLQSKYGRVAEWLGSGLQNRVRRFESARDLNYSKKPTGIQWVSFWVLNIIRNKLLFRIFAVV